MLFRSYIERRLEELQTTPPNRRRLFIIKDVRLFLNSVERNLRIVREAGIDARCEREDTEEAICLTIHIPRRPKPKTPQGPGAQGDGAP